MKHRNWFWGIFFILATVVLIASQLWWGTPLGFWHVLGVILLAAVVIQSCMYRMWAGIFLPVALGYILLQGPLEWFYISPWILIVSAILLSIGFQLLFQSKSWRNRHHGHHSHDDYSFCGVRPDPDISVGGDNDNPTASVRFGNSVRYLQSDCMKSGKFTVRFGSLEVYMDDVTLSPEGADLYMDCSFGAIELHIPRNWPVEQKTHANVGGVSFKNEYHARPDASLPPLRLHGEVSLGGVEITFI